MASDGNAHTHLPSSLPPQDPTPSPLERHHSDALGILDEVSVLANERFRTGHLSIRTKHDGSPVTEVDQEIERLLHERLSRLCPGDGILGEEYPEVRSRTGNRWIIDPIDGTRSFIRGVPLYATLMAYEVKSKIVFGAISFPSLGQTIYAAEGAGCWSNGQRAYVSRTTELGDSYVMATNLEDWGLETLGSLRRAGTIVKTWGDAFGYAMVATGRADAMVDFDVKPFDIAPAIPILQEAGGIFTSHSGQVGLNNGNSIGSNGRIHDALLAEITRNKK